MDLSAFTDVVADALTAFTHDVSYAVSIARAASVIRNKRAQAAARRELREAEARAHAECSQTSFHCNAVGPCGVADCKFAIGDLNLLQVAALPGQTRRPQPNSLSEYSLEPAVAPLAAMRRIEPGA